MKKSTIVGIVVVVIIIVIAGAYLAMQKSGKGGTTPVGDNPVSISGFAFSPALINVSVGDNVTWKNNDATTHTVTSDTGSAVQFSSGDLGEGATYTFVFTQAGDFPYHCSIHPSMHGVVHVAPLATG
jgi:plastocyanin